MKKTISVDTHLDSYRSFFDHDWAKRIQRLALDTILDEPVFNLGAAWKAAANTHVLPWLMVEQLHQFSVASIEAGNSFGANYLTAILGQLARDSKSHIPHDVMRQLRTLLQGHLVDVELQRDRRISAQFSPRRIWEGFLGHSEFRISLWGSQRLVYGAIYYAYEDFLLRSCKLSSGDESISVRDLKVKLAAEFGSALRDDCWTHPQVNIARLARNALVHNGGRLTADLKRVQHQFEVVEGEIQIMAPDTKTLFDLLKVRALRLTVHILGQNNREIGVGGSDR